MTKKGRSLNTECHLAGLAVSAGIIGYWDPTMATEFVVWMIPVGLVIVIGINILSVGKNILRGFFPSLLLTIQHRCIRRSTVLVQVNISIKFPSVSHLTHLFLAQ